MNSEERRRIALEMVLEIYDQRLPLFCNLAFAEVFDDFLKVNADGESLYSFEERFKRFGKNVTFIQKRYPWLTKKKGFNTPQTFTEKEKSTDVKPMENEKD